MQNFIQNFSLRRLRQMLFENAGIRQTIAKNTFWLGLSEFSINLLKFVLLVYATRVLGDTGFGQFAFVSSLIAIFGIFFDLGLSEAVTREFAKEIRNEEHIATLFSFQIFISIVVGAALFATSFFVSNKVGNVQTAVLIMGGYMFIVNLQTFFYAVFRARQKMEMEFFPNLLQNLAITGFGFFILYKMPTVASLSLAYFLGALLAFVPTLIYFHRYVTPLRLNFNKEVWKKFLHIAYPLALIGAVAIAIYNNIDSIMLGFFGQIKENGWYSAAYRVVTFSLLPMSFISQSFFPALSGAFRESKEKLEHLLHIQIQIMLFLGLPILFGGYALSDSLITFLYPAEFHPAALVLKILIGITFLLYLYNPIRQVLVVHDLQQKVFIVLCISMLINIILNLITIPIFSLYGAAISTLITQFFVLSGLLYLIFKKTQIRPINRETTNVFIIALVSSIIMFYVLHSLHNLLNVFVLLGAGVIVYITIFLAFYFLIRNMFTKKTI